MNEIEQKPVWLPTVGSECRVTSLGGNSRVSQRLAQMGVLPGVRLTVTRVAPFGATVGVRLDQGAQIALRTSELHKLGCEPLVLPLSQIALWSERRFRVVSLASGRRHRQRLQALGVGVGVILELQGDKSWPLRLSTGSHPRPFELGLGAAEKILVSRADAD